MIPGLMHGPEVSGPEVTGGAIPGHSVKPWQKAKPASILRVQQVHFLCIYLIFLIDLLFQIVDIYL